MSTPTAMEAVRVIDTDTHVSEPADLWTSRVPARWYDAVPKAVEHPDTGFRTWRIGDVWLREEAWFAQAGWKTFPPDYPKHLDDEGVDPGAWQASARIERMDEYGIYAEVLYPNVIGFYAPLFMRMDPEIALACVRAYNDFLTEFASVDPARLIPIAMVPFWDIDAALVEMERCAAMGHRGILFANKYEKVGLPPCWDVHWDPVYAAAQEMGLPVNFHVAVGENDGGVVAERRGEPVQPRRQHQDDHELDARERGADRGDDHERTVRPVPRTELRVGGERIRLPAVPARVARLALGRAGRTRRARAVAERVLPAPVLRHVLVRDHHAPVARAARRQRDVRDGLSAPDQLVSGARPHRRCGRPTTSRPTSRTCRPTSSARCSTTTPPGSTTSTADARGRRRCSCRETSDRHGQRDASSSASMSARSSAGSSSGRRDQRSRSAAAARPGRWSGTSSAIGRPGARDREPSAGLDSVEHVTAVLTKLPRSTPQACVHCVTRETASGPC